MSLWAFLLGALATCLGSLGGVSLAFHLERRRERRRSIAAYTEQVYGCRHELDWLVEQVEHTRESLRPGEPLAWSFEAPCLQTLVATSGLHRHGAYALVVSMASLLRRLTMLDNAIRSLCAGPGDGLTEPQAAYVLGELDWAARTTRYAQRLLDEELKRLIADTRAGGGPFRFAGWLGRNRR